MPQTTPNTSTLSRWLPDRKHRSEDRCDGDAELCVLAADTTLSNLEYLAIASGAPASTSSFDSLPFRSLPRYRDLG
jgi:hypothetical protein